MLHTIKFSPTLPKPDRNMFWLKGFFKTTLSSLPHPGCKTSLLTLPPPVTKTSINLTFLRFA